MPAPTIIGERITLRQIRKSDAISIQKHANDKLISRYMILLPYPYKLEDAYSWIRICHRVNRSKTDIMWGIQDNDTGEIIGGMGLHHINYQNKNAETGYWIGRIYWRRGLMSEAVKMVLKYSFSDLKLVRVYAVCMQPNKASMGVLKKLGFTKEGILRKACYKNRRWYDIHTFGILKEEFGK
ncbi:MAG: GNAT family N-acetyltransferase [bacterium]